jgi:hypothetical protein
MAGQAGEFKNKWYRFEGCLDDVVPQNFCKYCCGGVQYHGMHLLEEATGKQDYFVMLRQEREKNASCVCRHDVIETSPGKYKISTACTGRLATLYELKWEYPHTFCAKMHQFSLKQMEAVSAKILETGQKTPAGKDRVAVEIWRRGKKICTHSGQREFGGEIRAARHCVVYPSEQVKSTVL